MSLTVSVHEAKTRLSELLVKVEGGEEVVIARAGHPVAQLTRLSPPATRQFGQYDLVVPDSFSDPLPEQELRAWE